MKVDETVDGHGPQSETLLSGQGSWSFCRILGGERESQAGHKVRSSVVRTCS